MEHPSDVEIAEFDAGRLTEADRQAIHHHVEQCGGCRDRLAELKATSEAMKQWHPPAESKDLWPEVASRLLLKKPGPPWYRRVPLQLAASVAIAAAIGHGAGRLAATGSSPATEAQMPAEEQIQHYLHLDSLGPRLPVGMTNAITERLLQNGGDPS